MSDWRLRGQERYLKDVLLVHSRYRPYRVDWDHDHCAFCNAKFAETGGELQSGYATLDRYHWICDSCFTDFHGSFGWTVSAGDER